MQEQFEKLERLCKALEIDKIKRGPFKEGNIPDLWHVRASERIVEIVYDYLLRTSY